MAEHTLQQDPISLKLASLTMLALGSIGAILIGLATLANHSRRLQVIRDTQATVGEFVAQNETQMSVLFSETFSICQAEYELLLGAKEISSLDCAAGREALDQLDKTILTNYSASAFLKVENDTWWLLQASGTLMKVPNSDSWSVGDPEKRREITELARHPDRKVELWDNYINYLPGKEVVVPVKIADETLGYIFYSVIEP